MNATGARTTGPILLVEDDAVLANLLAQHLRAHGFTVEIQRTAEEAEAVVRGGLNPSLVLLDINLPGASGWSFVRSGCLGDSGSPPVVVMSAVPMSPSRLADFNLAGYLPKPFAMETLIDVVERQLSAQPRLDQVGSSK